MFTLKNFTVSTITPCSVWIWWWKEESIRFCCRKITTLKPVARPVPIFRLLILHLKTIQSGHDTILCLYSRRFHRWKLRDSAEITAACQQSQPRSRPRFPAVRTNRETERGNFTSSHKILNSSQSLSWLFWMMEFEELKHIMPGRERKITGSLLTVNSNLHFVWGKLLT